MRSRPQADSGRRVQPGCKPGCISGDRYGVPGREPQAEEGQGAGRRPGAGRRLGAPWDARHSPLAAALVAARRCKPGTKATWPHYRHRHRHRQGSQAPARSQPCAQRSFQRRRVSGLRSGESPPPSSAAGARRRRRRQRKKERPGPPEPRPNASHTARAPGPSAAPWPPLGGSRITSAAPPPRCRAAAPL